MAFGSSNDIDIKINIDADSAATKIKVTEASLKGLGSSAASAALGLTELNQGFELVSKAMRAVGAAIDFIKLGDQVADVSDNFSTLASKAGVASSVLLNDLNKATLGTVRNLDLMRNANRLLVAGFPTKYFDDLAKAATKYAEVQGRDVNQVLEDFVDKIATGRGAEKVIELVAQMQQLGEAAPGAAENLDRIGKSIADAQDKIAQSIQANEELNEALARLADTIARIDVTPLVNGLNQVISVSINAIERLAMLGGIINGAFVGLGGLIGQEAGQEIAESLMGVGESAETAATMIDFLNKSSQQLSKSQRGLTTETRADIAAMKSWLEQYKKRFQTGQQVKKQAEKEYDAHVQLYEQFKKLNSISGLRGAISQLQSIKQAYTEGLIPIERYSQEVSALVEEMNRLGIAQNTVGAVVRGGLGGGASFPTSGTRTDLLEGLFGVNFGAIEESLAGLSTSEQWGEAGRQIAIQIAQGLTEALTTLLNGGQVSGAQIGGVAGAGIGAIIGAAVAGPPGAMVGSQLGSSFGQLLGTVVEGMLGSDSAGTKARKELDKWFADLFDPNRLEAVVNGQLVVIEDLVFQGLTNFGGSVGLSDGTVFNFLNTLPAEVQSAFQGVGAAIAELTGQGEEMSQYLGAVLANNIGGSLNNLQLLLQATGASAQQLRDALFTAFNDGRMSAIELQIALQQIEAIAQVGIPGALGAVGEAFNNIAAAGFNGGDALLDALRDVGAEAHELGVNSLPQLANVLVNQFGIASQQVQAFMAAMSATGITNIQQLVDASNELLAALAANLQAITEGKPADFKPVAPTTPPSSSGSRGGSSGASRAQDDAKRNAEQQRQQILALVMANADYSAILQSVKAGVLDQSDAQKLINKLFQEAKSLLKERAELEERIARQQEKNGKVGVKLLERYAQKQKEIENFTKKQLQGQEEVFKGFLDFAARISDPNLLNIAAGAAGLDARAQIERDFAAGRITAEEARRRLQDAGPGIAGQFGRADIAVQNLLTSGTQGGVVSIDAFRDIFAEAREQGATSIEDVQKMLAAQGVAPEVINALITATQNAGITSVDQAISATNEAVIGILGTLQKMKFPFQETSEEIRKIAEEIANIPDTKKISIELDFDQKKLPPWLRDLLFGPNSPYGDDGRGLGSGGNKAGGNKKPGRGNKKK